MVHGQALKGQVWNGQTALLIAFALALLLVFCVRASRVPQPLLSVALFRVRSFCVAVLGGFFTRLGMGAVPFLLPLLFQISLGLPAWQSGLLLMPMAAAAMVMKVVSPRLLARHGYRKVLIGNTVLLGATMLAFATVGASTPLGVVVLLSLLQGLFNSLQFSSMNSLAYADTGPANASMASTWASTLQQMASGFGLALGSQLVAYSLASALPSDAMSMAAALHDAFVVLGLVTMLSSLSYWALRETDGQAVSRGTAIKT
jgi:MFS family permease